MASIYARGGKLWARIKGHKTPGKWASIPTDYLVGDETNCERWAQRTEDNITKRGDTGGPLTLARYALGEPYAGRDNWIERRRAMGVRSWQNEESRLRIHILPVLGHMALTEIRAMHVRDFVGALNQSSALKGSRSRREVYATLKRLYSTAVGDEIVEASPCQLHSRCRELPEKCDVDPDWRAEATYTQHEVERLISDTALPVDCLVQHALKSIAMLRHGEVAALRWKRYDSTMQPLGMLRITRAYDSRAREEKGPKKGPRSVPVHPTLAKILAEWKLSGWERVYGRAPTDEDLIVPNLALGYLDGPTVGRRFPRLLKKLGLRMRAGQRRNRGGHDLRAWGITRYQEMGAHRDILKLSSHGSGRSVIDGYTRVGWPAQCAEISKLTIERLDGQIIPLATGLATRSASQMNYWRKGNLPKGQQASQVSASVRESAPNHADSHDPSESSRTEAVARLATDLAAAVLAGDPELARQLASDLQELIGCDVANVRAISTARRAAR